MGKHGRQRDWRVAADLSKSIAVSRKITAAFTCLCFVRIFFYFKDLGKRESARRPVSRVLSAPHRDTGRSFLWDKPRGPPHATNPGCRAGMPLRPFSRTPRTAPIRSCSRWGLPCHPCCQGRGALLPHRFTRARVNAAASLAAIQPGGLFSVALSLRSPSPVVNRHRIPVEPGLSSSGAPQGRRPGGDPTATVRPSGSPAMRVQAAPVNPDAVCPV